MTEVILDTVFNIYFYRSGYSGLRKYKNLIQLFLRRFRKIEINIYPL